MFVIDKLIVPVISTIRRMLSGKHSFNRQYANKCWDGLWDIKELARYSIISGYIRYNFETPRVLDLGCGEGVLLEKLASVNYSGYLGIDFSNVAIEKAKKLETDKAHFRLGNLNNLLVEGLYEVIVYNESLYYLANPERAVMALFNNLAPGGIFIVSMHNVGTERNWIWAKLDEMLNLCDRTEVTNRDQTSWTVAVYSLREFVPYE